MHVRSPSSRSQRGAALLTAMIIVTLVATLAAAMVWQQWRAVQVEAAERSRAQSAWILSGALDFAKLILKETVRPTEPTTLNGEWATPLAESRLSTFLAVDKSNADDGPEAFLSGNITDAQASYNLWNLVKDGKPDPAEVPTLARLCTILGIESGTADRIAAKLSEASVGTSSVAPLKPDRIAQLTWLGVDSASIQALEPYVALLQPGIAVNVNTASKEVLQALGDLDPSTAEYFVQLRQRTPLTLDSFKSKARDPTSVTAKVSDRSTYFEVLGRLRLVDRVLVERSLLERLPNGQVKVWRRERVSSLEQAGG